LQFLHTLGLPQSALPAERLSVTQEDEPVRVAAAGITLALAHAVTVPPTGVYILQSESNPNRFYTGITSDLHARLSDHNRGQSTHSATGRPWRVAVAMDFSDASRAKAFEE
jgi:putative endonuclease